MPSNENSKLILIKYQSSLGNHPNMDLITFNEDKNLKMKGFLIFGEHSRELISPEAGLKLL